MDHIDVVPGLPVYALYCIIACIILRSLVESGFVVHQVGEEQIPDAVLAVVVVTKQAPRGRQLRARRSSKQDVLVCDISEFRCGRDRIMVA